MELDDGEQGRLVRNKSVALKVKEQEKERVEDKVA